MEVTKEFPISRMDCPTCVITLEKSVMKVPGVKRAQGIYLRKMLKVTYDDSTPVSAIEKAIEDVGYRVAYKEYPGPLTRLRGLFGRGESKAVSVVTDSDFKEKVLDASKPVAVLFSSESCPSCKMFEPKYEKLAEEKGSKADFYEMDVGANEAWKNYGVWGIPTVIVFRSGRESERFGAAMDTKGLEKILS